MYISLGFMIRNPEMTHEEFVNYWENVHAPLCRRLLTPLGLKRYTGMFPVESSALYAGGVDYDVVVELGFETKVELEYALISPEWQSEERRKSSNTCFDHSRATDMVVREIDALGNRV